LHAAWRGDRLVRTSLGPTPPTGSSVPRSTTDPARLLDAWIEAWIVHGPAPSLAHVLDWTDTPDRTRNILRTLESIPAGQVRTYAEIAALAGIPRGFQAVGQAMRRNPLPLVVPCHRVVGSNGALGGYSAGGPPVKALLLRHEGAGPQGL